MTDHHTPDHAQLEARYRALLVAQFRTLRLEGLAADARPIVLPLEEVYVQLRTVAAVPEAADSFTPEERRLLKLLEERRVPDAELREAQLRLDALRHQRWTHERPERFPIAAALADPDKRGLVILGDPGSGKSTLLQFLALVFAQGPEAAERQLQVRGPDAARRRCASRPPWRWASSRPCTTAPTWPSASPRCWRASGSPGRWTGSTPRWARWRRRRSWTEPTKDERRTTKART
jgi:hypothetical protein